MTMRRVMAAAVAAACGSIEEASRGAEQADVLTFSDGKEHPDVLRRLSVDIKVEVQALGDTLLSQLVEQALREYLDKPAGRGEGGDAMQGKFESTAGLDVSWRAINRYYVVPNVVGLAPRLVGEVGVDESENRIDWYDEDAAQREARCPVPVALAHLNGDGSVLTIKGVRFGFCVFDVLANPDPAKRYAFERHGDTVTVREV